VAIYMKFGTVDGNVTTEGFNKWIELKSASWGINRAVSSAAGNANREGTAPSLSDVVVSKEHDSSSGKLMNDALAGAFDSDVVIKWTTTTKNKTETYLTYELTECGVSSYAASSGGDNPNESLSLNFVKLTMTPTYLDKSGNIKRGDIITYDLKLMKTM